MTARLCLLLLTTTCALGCKPASIRSEYGHRRGLAAESVNGTAVLADMFEQAGHRVTGWRRLSPKLEQSQTIVWFPDDFSPPDQDQREFLENWLSNEAGRTLVYVGRDYDAAITYWTKILPQAPPTQALDVHRRLAFAQAAYDRQRSAMPAKMVSDWFVLRRDAPRQTVTRLSGPWAKGVDVKRTEIEINARLDVPQEADIATWANRTDYPWIEPPQFEHLLTAGDDPLVTRLKWDEVRDSQLLVVTNGSFLLNLPLVNHEHRKLAHQLIAACGRPGRTVFLESGSGGPTVYETEPGANAPTGFEVFTVWPLGVILVHLTILGFLACFALFPVFGRPRELSNAQVTDFGKHIDALGELLKETGDREYAWQKLQSYQEHVRHEAGTTSHKKRPPEKPLK